MAFLRPGQNHSLLGCSNTGNTANLIRFQTMDCGQFRRGFSNEVDVLLHQSGEKKNIYTAKRKIRSFVVKCFHVEKSNGNETSKWGGIWGR